MRVGLLLRRWRHVMGWCWLPVGLLRCGWGHVHVRVCVMMCDVHVLRGLMRVMVRSRRLRGWGGRTHGWSCG